MLRVAILQFQPILLDVKANLAKISSMLEPVEADLVVLPELATSGYVFDNLEEVQSVAETSDGYTYQLLSEIASRKNMSIVIGFPELSGTQIFNSSMLINPDKSCHVYRKTHLFFREKEWFSPGDTGFNVFTAKKNVKIGLMICFDWIFPESARTLMLKGAQIICHSANLVLPWCQNSMPVRALENRVFCVTANRIGEEINGEHSLFFTGKSQIVDQTGNILLRYTEDLEEIHVIEIDPEFAEDKQLNFFNNLISDRKPEFYL